jgi:hypothetical protein
MDFGCAALYTLVGVTTGAKLMSLAMTRLDVTSARGGLHFANGL